MALYSMHMEHGRKTKHGQNQHIFLKQVVLTMWIVFDSTVSFGPFFTLLATMSDSEGFSLWMLEPSISKEM